MPGSVVVVGSINVDLVVTLDRLPAPGETVIGGRFARHGGGKGANQAVAAARAGADVRFVGAVGADDFGADAVAELAREGIDVSAIARLGDEATGVALIAVDGAGRNQIAVASGANARVDAAMVARAAGELRPDDVSLLGFEVPDAAVAAAARAAAAAGARIVLNPAPARPLPDELRGLRIVATPNADEARTLGGAAAIARHTGGPVIVTEGADGAVLRDGTTEIRLPAPAIDVVDTTGAGDAFNGVLAAGLAGGLDLRTGAERAGGAGAAGRAGGGGAAGPGGGGGRAWVASARPWPPRPSATTSPSASRRSRSTSPTPATRCPTSCSTTLSWRSRVRATTTTSAPSCSPPRTRPRSAPAATSRASRPTCR